MCSLDRKGQKKVTNWETHHNSWENMWNQEVTKYERGNGTTETRPFNQETFNEYLAWFLSRTRVEICPRAYDEAMLDNPIDYEDVANAKYTKLVREGRRTQFAPLINYMVNFTPLLFLLQGVVLDMDVFIARRG